MRIEASMLNFLYQTWDPAGPFTFLLLFSKALLQRLIR